MDTFFVFERSDDTCDNGYRMIGHPDISIQIARYAGGFFVNQWVDNGTAMAHFGPYKTLKQAQEKCLKLANVRIKA